MSEREWMIRYVRDFLQEHSMSELLEVIRDVLESYMPELDKTYSQCEKETDHE